MAAKGKVLRQKKKRTKERTGGGGKKGMMGAQSDLGKREKGGREREKEREREREREVEGGTEGKREDE